MDKVAEQEAIVSEFIEDARSVMDDPEAGEGSLVKIASQGERLINSVGDEAIAAIDRTTETVHRKNACQKDPNCPAGRVRRLEKIEKAQETEHEALKALYARLSAFMDEVRARLNKYAGESEEPDEDQEFLEERASDFIEENQELLDDPEISSDVLGRIFEHGTWFIVNLGKAYEEAAYEEVPLANIFNEAQNDTSLSPKELLERELPYRRAKKKAQGRYAAFERFKEFMEELNERREAKREEERAVEREVDFPTMPVERPAKAGGIEEGEDDVPQRNMRTKEERSQGSQYPDPPNINKADLDPTPPDPDESEWYQPYREPSVKKLPWWKRLLGVHQEEPSEPRESPTMPSQAVSDREDYGKLLTWYEQNLEVLEKAVAGKQAGEPGDWQQVIDELLDRMAWCDRHMDTIEGRNADMASSELVSRRESLASRRAELGE